jgi:hypothetical protein
MQAIGCFAKVNFVLSISTEYGFSPLADASPFNELVSTKYRRALSTASEKTTMAVPATDLSLAILDELVPAESLFNLNLGDVIRYRRDSERSREAFLEHLAALQPKLSAVPADRDYGQAIRTLIDTDIRPAATSFRNQMIAVYKSCLDRSRKGLLQVSHLPLHISWATCLGLEC